jgi:UDP-N-acetylglucosamine 2-epimerase (non-hydrolysing)
MKIVAVVGARPNFVKIAPIMKELRRRRGAETCLVHTGQHFDQAMSAQFFQDLDIPAPDVELHIGAGSPVFQISEIMQRFEPVLLEHKPDVVMVVGDVNSTVAAALTAAKLDIPIAHVESGLRSFDRTMPEEINRLVTDTLSHWLFVSEPSGIRNLRREGINDDRIYFVGNVMVDTLLQARARSERSTILEQLEVSDRPYVVLTLHRPSNVDHPAAMSGFLGAVAELGPVPVIFPVHPRTRQRLEQHPQDLPANLRLTPPLGYLDCLRLLSKARVVLTDSGGIQEETTALGVPCLTLRRNTERPATIEQGTNLLVGVEPQTIVAVARRVLNQQEKSRRIPDLWDGQTAQRMVDILLNQDSRIHALANSLN